MPEVVAIHSFEHNGKRKRGEQFFVSDAHALALSRAGLVMMAEENVPTSATGKEVTLSASQVALVLPTQTATLSSDGALRHSKAGRPRKERS